MSGGTINPAWDAWMSYHSRVFDLRTQDDMDRLAEWVLIFERLGWTPDELAEASQWLASNAPRMYPRDHLPALQDRVRARRFEEARKLGGEDRGVCRDCGNAGLVVVPHPTSTHPGAAWYTQAVACRCALGNVFVKQGGHMDLDRYEQVVPDWRQRIAAHEAYVRRLASGHRPSPAFELIVARLQARRMAMGGQR